MRVVLCDDHPIYAEGMRFLLTTILPEASFEIVTTVSRLQERLTDGELVDLLLLDVTLPDGEGTDVLPLDERQSECAVVVLSALKEPERIRRALSLGARGFIPKDTPLAVLRQAIKLVLSGGLYVPPAMLDLPGVSAQEKVVRDAPTTNITADAYALTARQREIAELVAKGLTNREICDVLKISENTVKAHLRAIFKALDVSNRTEATMVWLAS